MLKQIRLVNFQCHIDKVVDLHPHVTVLVGDNRKGKSAIIRGLRWAALNQWQGKADQFIHWNGEDAQVDLVFDKVTISRLKGKQGNFYLLNGEPIGASVGVKIPDAVQKIINLTEDNFQDQLDPAFWFSLTCGQVARSLNKIVNLSDIDSSLAGIGESVRAAKAKLKVVEANLEEAKSLKKSLDWTIQADADLKALEAKQQKLVGNRAGLQRLARWRELLTSQSRREKHAADAILRGDKLIDKMGKLEKLRKKLDSLESGLDRISQAQESIKCVKTELAKKEPRLINAQAGRCPLCQRA